MGNIVAHTCFRLLCTCLSLYLNISLTIIILKLRKHYIARGSFVDQSRSTYIFIRNKQYTKCYGLLFYKYNRIALYVPANHQANRIGSLIANKSTAGLFNTNRYRWNELTAALGWVFKSSKAMTVKGLLVLWSNFHGLSMVPLIVYLTYPVPPSNDEGRLGGSVKVKGYTCCPGGSRLSSPIPKPVQNHRRIFFNGFLFLYISFTVWCFAMVRTFNDMLWDTEGFKHFKVK